MPTYTISAPDGNTYSIDGPPGATDDQVRAQVLAQHPNAGTPAKPSLVDRFVKFADDAGQSAQNFLQKNGRTLATGAGAIAGGILAAPEAAVAAIPTAGVGGIATEAGGMGLGGAIGGNLYDMATGRRQKLAQQLGTTVQDFAGNAAAAPAGRLLGAGVEAAAPYVAPAAARALRALSQGGSATKAAVGSVSARISSLLDAGATPAAQGEQAAAMARALAQRDAQAQAAATARAGQTASEAVPAPAPVGVGQVQAPTDLGAPVQQAASAGLEQINAAKEGAYGQARAASDAAAAEQAGNGNGVSDMPAAQKLVEDAKQKLNPIGNVVTNLGTQQRAVYEKVVDELTPKTVPLTPEQAKAAQQAGQKVNVVLGAPTESGLPGPSTYTITQKPSLMTIENLRRGIANGSFDGVQGSAAIDKLTKQDIYGALSRAEDEYTAGLSQTAKDAWKAGLDAAAPYTDTALGRTLVGEQADTGITRATAAQVPTNIINKGREGYDQAVQLAGPATAKTFVQNAVETALHDPKTGGPVSYAQAISQVGPKSKLGDILQSPDLADVRSQVDMHLSALKASEEAQTQAQDFAKTAATAQAAQTKYANLATKLSAIKDPAEMLRAAKDAASSMLDDGAISPQEFMRVRAQINAADTLAEKRATNYAILKWAGTFAGVGVGGRLGLQALAGH